MSRMRETEKTAAAREPVAADRAAFIGRLQRILRHWPSADRLARATGVSPSAFRKWLRGEAEPSRERLVSLAKAAGVAAGWLASGEGAEPRFETISETPRGHASAAFDRPGSSLDRDGYVLLPKRPETAAAGVETPPSPPFVEFIALRHDWVRAAFGIEPKHLAVETALGESMQPGIQDGDLLFVDTSENRLSSFGVYVLEISAQRLVKRVQPKLDGSLTLISDNSAYEPEHISPEHATDVRVIGRVIWTCGPTRQPR